MYTVTGEQKFADMAIRVGDNLIATQNDNGAWGSSHLDRDHPNNDATAELVVWLDEIHQAVGIE